MITADVLTLIEVDRAIEMGTGGLFSVEDAKAVVLREMTSRESRDGVAFWAVSVALQGMECVLKSFVHERRAAAEAYGEKVAWALGIELSR